jgi:hypothetical protein
MCAGTWGSGIVLPEWTERDGNGADTRARCESEDESAYASEGFAMVCIRVERRRAKVGVNLSAERDCKGR